MIKWLENKIVRAGAVAAAIAAIVALALAYWPSPWWSHFEALAGESLDNTIHRVQQDKRFFEAESVKAKTQEQRQHWQSQKEKADAHLKRLFEKKHGKK